MRISTKGRYGMYLMLDLASNYSKKYCICLKNIAERQGISEKYLEQIVQLLVTEKLIVSTRGAYGGYKLSSAPSEISVGTILKCLEKPMDIMDCDDSTDKSDFLKLTCEEVYEKIRENIFNLIDNISLEDLINKYNNGFVMDYVI